MGQTEFRNRTKRNEQRGQRKDHEQSCFNFSGAVPGCFHIAVMELANVPFKTQITRYKKGFNSKRIPTNLNESEVYRMTGPVFVKCSTNNSL